MSSSTKAPAMHPNKEAFIEGVDHVLAKWTALVLAVANSWGGPETQDKRDDMVDEIVEFFDAAAAKRQAPEPTDLEELLKDILEEDFTISLEDGSEKEVASILTRIFNECRTGNFETVDKLADERDAREARGEKDSVVTKSQGASARGGDDMDSSSGEEDGEEDYESGEEDAMEED
ncbi:rRNA accumulation- protein [Coemansia sp. Benny D115]|nr:rRNA accumulation- protein [Coemansia sp. Benny D115]